MRWLFVLPLPHVALLAASCVFGEDNRNHRLGIWDSETGEWEIVSGDGTFGEAVWQPDSSAIVAIEDGSVVMRSPSGKQLWKAGRAGGELDGPVALTASPNGEVVAVLGRVWLSGREIVTLDLLDSESGKVRETVFEHENIRLSGANQEGYDVAWSGDGKTVAVIAPRAPGLDVFWLDVDADWEVTTTPTVEAAGFVRAAPVGDGFLLGLPSGLLYTTGPGDSGVIYQEPAQGSRDPGFSPDGKHVVFGTRGGLVVADVLTGAFSEIGGAASAGPAWGHDRIAFPGRGGIATIEPDRSDERTIVEFGDGRYARALAWSPDGRYLAFIVVPEYRD